MIVNFNSFVKKIKKIVQTCLRIIGPEFPSWLNLCNSCVMHCCTVESCWHSGEQITFHTEWLWDRTVSAAKKESVREMLYGWLRALVLSAALGCASLYMCWIRF